VERILNQEEIDELLAAFDGGEIDVHLEKEAAEKPGPASRGEAYIASIDLTRGQNYSKWRIANLDIVFNSFARYYSIALSNSLQQGVNISKGDIVSRFFEDFLADLDAPGVLGAFSMEPLKGAGLFVFDRRFCFGLVEVLFGMAAASDFVIPNREVTAIEANIIRSLMAEACQVFNRSFAALGELQTSISRVETSPKMINILAPDTEVIEVQFKARLGALEGEILMIIPYFSLEPYKEKLRDEQIQLAEGKKENTWVRQLERELQRMEIPVAATWGELSLTIQEILGLEAGDIVSFDYDEAAPIRVTAGDQPKFAGQPGVKNGKKVVRVVKPLPLGE
jgi:flagellar motor switch protein FliM